MTATPYTYGALPTLTPLKLSIVQNMFDNMNYYQSVLHVSSEIPVVPDNLYAGTDLFTTTSTSFVDLPGYSLSIPYNAFFVYVPVYLFMTGAYALGEFGLNINGVFDTTSVVQMFNNPAQPTYALGRMNYFHFSELVPGIHNIQTPNVVKFQARVISGTTPQISIRYSQASKMIVRAA